MRLASLFALVFLLPSFVSAVELININTADAALLDTLPGVGSVIAGRIISYREVNGPFVTIKDIQKVSGIGSGSTYTKIEPLITVGDTSASDSGTDQTASSTPISTSSDSSTTTTPSSNSGGPPEYVPIPTLHIVTGGDRTISSGADTAFTAVVYDGKGNKRDNAMVTWSFGDGMKRVGANVYHQYYEQGEYLAIIRATTSDGGDAFKEITITVKNASIKIASVSARGISLVNDSSRTLDLSLWRLSMGGKEFKIPEDTQILSGRTTLFPSQIIQLPLSDTASLLYPSGEAAATYTSVQAMQPSAPIVSYEKVQTVEPIISTAKNIQTYENAVIAPAEATELAAAGAALPAVASVEQQKSGGLFKSPWFYSLLGVMALAGAAFIFI